MKHEGFTPGPWTGRWIIRGPSKIVGYRENGESIPSLPRVVAHIIDRDNESAANTALIAAAPALLAENERLRALLARCVESKIRPEGVAAYRRALLSDIRAALAATKGNTP